MTDLRGAGYKVEETRRASQFARLQVRTVDGLQLDVDLGVDWRRDEPVALSVGAVLSLSDAVGSKVSALYSRGEPRDYLDVDAIRSSGQFTDAELVRAAGERDAGFDVAMFAEQLEGARHISPIDLDRYGASAKDLEAVKTRFAQWAARLRAAPTTNLAG